MIASAFANLSPLEQVKYVKREVAKLTILVGMIEATISQPEERDLVWENYGAGYGWFKADLTAKNRGPL